MNKQLNPELLWMGVSGLLVLAVAIAFLVFDLVVAKPLPVEVHTPVTQVDVSGAVAEMSAPAESNVFVKAGTVLRQPEGTTYADTQVTYKQDELGKTDLTKLGQ